MLPLGPLGGARLKLVGCSYTTSPWLPMRECMCVGCMDARMLRAMVLVRYMPRHICCALGDVYKFLEEEDKKNKATIEDTHIFVGA